VLLGLTVALALPGVLQSLLFGVGRFDAPTFAGMSLLMLAVAAVASYLPAHRASAVDPIRALRGE
jgi:putative ABC transport system permease protein